MYVFFVLCTTMLLLIYFNVFNPININSYYKEEDTITGNLFVNYYAIIHVNYYLVHRKYAHIILQRKTFKLKNKEIYSIYSRPNDC